MGRFIITLVFTFTFFSAYTSHILGGLLSHVVTSVDSTNSASTIRFDLQLYRDPFSSGSFLEAEVKVGIYSKNANGEYIFYQEITSENLVLDRHISDEFGTEIEIGNYDFVVKLDQGRDYLIAYQRCCRAVSIANLIGSDEIGFAIQTEITAEALEHQHTAPVFETLPETWVKVGKQFEDDWNLRYSSELEVSLSLVSPLQAGGTFDATGPTAGNMGCCECVRPNPDLCGPPFSEVSFGPEYEASIPLGMDPLQLETDSRLTGVLNTMGTFQYGVEIVTTRNGEVLSRQILDYVLIGLLPESTREAEETFGLLYPNPSDGSLNLSALSFDPSAYKLYSTEGELLGEETIIQEQIHLSVSPGCYLIEIFDQEGRRGHFEKVVRL